MGDYQKDYSILALKELRLREDRSENLTEPARGPHR